MIKKIILLSTMISWSMFFALSMTGFSKGEDTQDKDKTEQAESKKKTEEGKSLKGISKDSKKKQKKDKKVYTNIDLKNSKGNISTSTLSKEYQTEDVGDAGDDAVDEELKQKIEMIRRSELEIQYMNKLVSAFCSLEYSEKLHKQSEKDLKMVLNQFPAAVGNTKELKNLAMKKELLLGDLDRYQQRIKKAQEDIERLNVEILAKGLSSQIIQKAQTRAKKMVQPSKSKGKSRQEYGY